MDDRTLRQDVLDELEFEPSIDAANIGVAVAGGVVTLTGHVTSYGQKHTVERIVGQVRGVKGIAEEIEVRLPGTGGTSDDEIARRAVQSLHWSAVVPDDAVQVKVQQGWITLTGKVEWNYQKAGAVETVRNLAGVAGINDLIELVPRISGSDVQARIEAALRRNALLEARGIEVTVAGNRVVLAGNVRNWAERHLAEQAAWATPGVTAVEDQLTIS